jgi:hypothetical protein
VVIFAKKGGSQPISLRIFVVLLSSPKKIVTHFRLRTPQKFKLFSTTPMIMTTMVA